MRIFALFTSVLLTLSPNLLKSQSMKDQFITSSIGDISVHIKEAAGNTPIIFLHGVYYDHQLWAYQSERINDRTVITLDMPFHGNSKKISKADWTLDDCANMLLEVLDSLKIDKVIAVGHSWGSMTILRAAAKSPERFESLGFCNMPYKASSPKRKRQFRMQHSMLSFRKFYTKQVAKAMYGQKQLKEMPELQDELRRSFSILTNKEVKQTDKAVIIQAKDSEALIQSLKIPVLALKGKDDYVSESNYLSTQIVEGGHISPMEVPEKVYEFVLEVIAHSNSQLGGK
ncbi:MAG: alpha/beta hydrolase [Bacteroidia bacterium]|nr:alpha/beta hydrolase [Bacteroidia bacterium]